MKHYPTEEDPYRDPVIEAHRVERLATLSPQSLPVDVAERLADAAIRAGSLRADDHQQAQEILEMSMPRVSRVIHSGPLAVAIWDEDYPAYGCHQAHPHGLSCLSSIVEREEHPLALSNPQGGRRSRDKFSIRNPRGVVVTDEIARVPYAQYRTEGRPPQMAKADQPRYPLLAGERNPNAKLTEPEVAEIKARLGVGATQQEMADLFNVGLMTVSDISRGATWAWVKPATHPREGTMGPTTGTEGQGRAVGLDLDDPRLVENKPPWRDRSPRLSSRGAEDLATLRARARAREKAQRQRRKAEQA